MAKPPAPTASSFTGLSNLHRRPHIYLKMKLRLHQISCSLPLLLVAFSFVTAALLPGSNDATVWHHALGKYEQLHQDQQLPFLARDADLARYSHIQDLKSRALNLGKERGVFYVGRIQGTLPHEHAVIFSTLILPEDALGQSMHLQDKVALALFKKDLSGTNLIDIDAFTHVGTNWPLKPFRQIVGLHP